MVLNKSNQVSEVIETKSEFSGSRFYDTKAELSLDHELLSPSLVNSISKEVRLRPIPSRIDYNYFNYCSTCELKYPKEILRCKDCKQKIRVKPWHRSKILDCKRI